MISNTAGHDYCNVRNMKSVDFDINLTVINNSAQQGDYVQFFL